MPRRAPLALALSLLLAACASPDGAMPAKARLLEPAHLDAGSAIAAAAQGEAAAWPDETWWTVLGDPQLDRLVQRAQEGNPGLRASAARVRLAQALAGVTEAAAGPAVNASASADRTRYPEHGAAPAAIAGRTLWKENAALTGAIDLDAWGRHREALQAALGDVKVAEAEQQMVRLALQTAIVRAYIRLAHAYALHDLATATLQQRQRQHAMAQKRHAAGLSGAYETAALAATLPAGERGRQQAMAAIALLQHQLAALTGQGPGDGERIARPVLNLGPAQHPGAAHRMPPVAWAANAALPSALPAQLIGRRPDVAAQRWRIEAAARRIGAARADFYPDINIAAFAGLQAFGFTRLLEAGSRTMGVAPAINLPVFDSGRLRSRLGAQRAAWDIAVEQYNGAVVQALADVAGAVSQQRAIAAQLQQSEAAQAAAMHAETLAERAWRAGLTDADAVINARMSALHEQQNVLDMSARLLENHTLLMAALGGGVKAEIH
ncbi:efflux transporter outer membrane subunit [Pseudoduganella ginsengisoli]|uniref:Efflux transporter outer membrane subunit n=2 Tax=Pseudoduganella ginsengisoli TaxID=1462440 RepID=A0A6L6Q393_9BURK|nr:efflux transporter outer membrane subunit [Pseudoduganella ginsengisoli]